MDSSNRIDVTSPFFVASNCEGEARQSHLVKPLPGANSLISPQKKEGSHPVTAFSFIGELFQSLKQTINLYNLSDLSLDWRDEQNQQHRIDCCKLCFHTMLDAVYQLQIPFDCQALLQMRKEQIAQRFNLDEADPRLLVFTGELLFLRIIIPFLIKQATDSERSILINFTKILQALANQTGSVKKDAFTESFFDLYEKFIPVHLNFMKVSVEVGVVA